ncbi:MAG: Ig-like domain repeat protein, partial [Actinobacteria bacterium]|nr:Ig-like domain repeat protein [Actinomycetota bacterium]
TYSGDANYLPITTPVGCGVAGEMFTVATLPIGLVTQASTNAPNVAPGTAVTDTAIFTPPPGGPPPTGTVTYTLVGPNPNATCTAPVVGAPSTMPVGTPSAPYIVTAPGTYNFVATYSGDPNYSAITTPVGCGDPDEMFTVALQPVTFVTQASTNSTTVTPGTAVTDIATFTPPPGGPGPTGTVTYTLVGPNPDANCTAPVVGTSTVAVGAPSAPFTVTAPGAYNFVATYSGDAFYAPITTPVGCNVPAERFVVATQPVTLVTQASTNSTTVPPGTVVTDLATITVPAGGPPATGTVTYTLVGPVPNATCTGPVVGAPSTVPVGQPSGPFTVTAAGTYNFVATYSGDANYQAITTPVGCGVPSEMFAVALR